MLTLLRLLLLLLLLLHELLLLRCLDLHSSLPQLTLDVLHQQIDSDHILSTTRNDDISIALSLARNTNRA